LAAQLIGDFNNWGGTWMDKNEFGVWSVNLPDGTHHHSKVTTVATATTSAATAKATTIAEVAVAAASLAAAGTFTATSNHQKQQ